MHDVEELIGLLRERDGQEFDGEVHLTSEEAERLTKALTVSPEKLSACAEALWGIESISADAWEELGPVEREPYEYRARAILVAAGLKMEGPRKRLGTSA